MNTFAKTPSVHPNEQDSAHCGETPYEFPATVRLLSQPAFKFRVIETLEARIQQHPQPHLYKLLVDVYRRAGDLSLAAETAGKWHAQAPNDHTAAYTLHVLKQQPLADTRVGASDIRAAPYLIIDNFFSHDEREYFWRKATHSESVFKKAGLGIGENLVVDCYRRDTNVLALDKAEKNKVRDKIRPLVNDLFQRFQIPACLTTSIEVKLTAHGQDGFFKIHQDGFSEIGGAIRQLSWIYYFHNTPKPYAGGDLILFDSDCQSDDHQFAPADYTRYIPQDNSIIFFPSWFYHGVTPVNLLAPGFISSRFAIAGHVRC